ncbi:hypothetical protein EBR66_08080 [bacterium]|nr:hypothetical protein [bacterium]
MTYLTHLQDTAYAIQSAYTISLPKITVPELFFAVVLRSLDPKRVTMNGLDNMLDVLFNHPDMLPLLTDLSYQDRLKNETPKAIQKYWVHIIIPAWNHHIQLQEVKRNSRQNISCTSTLEV